jgi:chemotaxis protein methyltransferase CheR
MEAVARQMPADGLLYLGGAETVLGTTDRFVAAQGERGVYQLGSAKPVASAPIRMTAAAP